MLPEKKVSNLLFIAEHRRFRVPRYLIDLRLFTTCPRVCVLIAVLFQMEEDLETDGGEGAATNCHVGDGDLEDDINVSLEELPHQSPTSFEDGASVRYSKVYICAPNLPVLM